MGSDRCCRAERSSWQETPKLPALGRVPGRQGSNHIVVNDTAIAGFGPGIDRPGPKRLVISKKSAVAQAVRRALPLRDIVGDHAGRFHRRLAELGITRNLALNALPLGMQDIAQALKL